jgi:predicted nucleotidyltransferase component of viral defense system
MKTGNAKSIRGTLKDITDREGVEFQIIVTRYLHERLIYRLSISEYTNNFLLKGGALLYAFQGLHTRPTIDIDMLAKRINNDKSNIKKIFEQICDIRYEDDCVTFRKESIIVSDIAEDAKYSGVRVLIDAAFDTIKQRLQIDLGFSDTVSSPINLDFPVLLEELDSPKIKAYSIETVIAEKFHAMITLGTNNSRMKDFLDVYTLLNNKDIDNKNLQIAILETFRNRETPYIDSPELFEVSFYQDTNRKIRWTAFLRKLKVQNIDFETVVKTITKTLHPIYNTLIDNKI